MIQNLIVLYFIFLLVNYTCCLNPEYFFSFLKILIQLYDYYFFQYLILLLIILYCRLFLIFLNYFYWLNHCEFVYIIPSLFIHHELEDYNIRFFYLNYLINLNIQFLLLIKVFLYYRFFLVKFCYYLIIPLFIYLNYYSLLLILHFLPFIQYLTSLIHLCFFLTTGFHILNFQYVHLNQVRFHLTSLNVVLNVVLYYLINLCSLMLQYLINLLFYLLYHFQLKK